MTIELGKSPALGLWAKHCFVMDELYEIVDPVDEDAEKEAPEEVRALLDKTEEGVLATMFESAEQDRDALLEAAIATLERVFASLGQAVSVERRKSQNAWLRGRYIKAAHSKKPLPKGAVWATVTLDNDRSVGSLSLTATLWSKGGQRAAQVFRQLPSSLRDQARTQELGFTADCVVISCLPLNRYSVPGEIALNMDGLIADLAKDLAQNDADALKAMLKGLRSL